MDEARFVIAGGGMVAGYAARELVELGLKPGELAIVSADTSLPYERPPLSKGFLAGKETEASVRINPQDFYRQHGIEVRLDSEITGVDPERKRILLRSGGAFAFDRLIVATGARARTLEVPGAALRNVYYLRSLDDSKAIRQRAADARRAVVAGGGFIGMEVAAVLAQEGIEVTMVLREDRIWKQFFSPRMSRFFEDYYAGRGVRFVRETAIAELRGADEVRTAVLANRQAIECDMVVAGIGVVPETAMLNASGVELENGIQVNEYLETGRPGILAAGDVANYQDTVFGGRRRVEHWDNAVSQGRYCAHALMGERKPFHHVPYFFSDVFDLSYEFWGDPSGAEQLIHRGDLSSDSFSVWWLRRQRLVAAFAMNRPGDEREAAPKWIESGQRVPSAALEDASHPLAASFA